MRRHDAAAGDPLNAGVRRVRVIDSHTAGEPTRVVLDGHPDLGAGSAAERLQRLRRGHDAFRTAVVNEPRGYDALVGALLLPAARARAVAQVIFFNNVGYLGMCGHGTIGVATTLAWLGRIGPGEHRLETPVGEVSFRLLAGGAVQVANVPCYRLRAGVAVDTPDFGRVVGDVAWGGNWFFLIDADTVAERVVRALASAELATLRAFGRQARAALAAAGVTGPDGAAIDHVELFGPPRAPGAHARNFVLCPGDEYDRSPCGTGTSAHLACLHADGRLAPGERYRQEGILGTCFDAWLEERGGELVPVIEGRAWVTAEATLLFDPDDPFTGGLSW